MMKLYTGDLSPYSARVRMQIYAKGITGIAFERPPEFGLPGFRARFPIGRIPVLEVDGEAIVESEVIAEYLETVHPEPSLLGADPLETARIRTLARLGDIYIMNNMFLLSAQARAATRSQDVVDLLGGQVLRNLKALDRMLGEGDYAWGERLTLADCALVPGLFMVDNVLPSTGIDNPIPKHARVAAYWAAIQRDGHAARVLAELQRGLEERRELIRSGAFDKFMAAAAAAMKAAGEA